MSSVGIGPDKPKQRKQNTATDLLLEKTDQFILR